MMMMMMMMVMMMMIVSTLTTKLIDFNFFIIKVTLTEMLIDAELSEYPDVPVNPYRKLLGIKIILILIILFHILITMRLWKTCCHLQIHYYSCTIDGLGSKMSCDFQAKNFIFEKKTRGFE